MMLPRMLVLLLALLCPLMGGACRKNALPSKRPALVVYCAAGIRKPLEAVAAAFEAASGRPVPWKVVERRPGDAAITVADPSLAAQRLGWRTHRTLADMCRDGWAWQSANPEGYGA